MINSISGVAVEPGMASLSVDQRIFLGQQLGREMLWSKITCPGLLEIHTLRDKTAGPGRLQKFDSGAGEATLHSSVVARQGLSSSLRELSGGPMPATKLITKQNLGGDRADRCHGDHRANRSPGSSQGRPACASGNNRDCVKSPSQCIGMKIK